MATEASISGTARRRSNHSSSAAEVLLGGRALLVIDPQIDFHEGGSLAVPGASEDAKRIARLIREHAQEIDELVVTMDSHHRLDIAHPKFWTDGKGEGCHPTPFTTITAEDARDGTWVPIQEDHKEHCIEYTRRLEEGGKFSLCIWPEHCLIGTVGQTVHPVVNDALQEWTAARGKTVTYVQKGQYTLSEHYSCFTAEVPMPGDEANDRGRSLLARLCLLDSVLVCGQAASHCVNFSTRDLAAAWKRTTAGASEADARRRMGRLVVLKDGTSAVTGFEEAASEFFDDMTAMGVSIRTCAEAFSS
ncbi:unnamed protein product [Ascophyllum nodosum]